MTINKVANISDFSEVYLEDASKYQILIFTADWISQSSIVRIISQKINSAAENANVFIVDAEKNEDFLLEYKVTHLPTCVIIKNKVIVDRLEGVFSKKDVLKLLQD